VRAPTAAPSQGVVNRREPRSSPPRRAYFGAAHGWLDTPILPRSALARAQAAGPLILEEYDATCVVPPGATARLDDGGNIRIVL
jgi:N-methylhydantoinase A